MPSPEPRPLLRASCPITADMHTHTHYSHGKASPEAMYLAAKKRGLAIYGFSEHSPRPEGFTYPSDYQEKLGKGFTSYIGDVERLKKRGKRDGVHVLLGLEVDFIPGQEDFASTLLARHAFDYAIGGLHFQGNWGFDFCADDWALLSEMQRFSVYERYYDDLASMCATGLFAIAAHPDLIKIFTVESFRAWLETDDALPRVRSALAAIKQQGMAMEVSSAGLRKPCKEIYPGPQIMALASEMGIPICFGSDAHCVNTPGHAFDELARYSAGFGYRHSIVVEQGNQRALPFTAPAPPPAGGGLRQ